MKLPFLNFFEKKVPTDYFLALLFRDEKIHAVVFEQISGRIQVVGQGKANLPTSLERASDEMLLDSCDKAISIAESSLPNGIQTHKTVFGVKETWVEDTHITKEKLTKLRTISDQLDLKPIGFLVFPEAIAHLLQKEEGAPVSAILVEAGTKQATLTLLRAGRIIGTKEIGVEDSLTQTVEDGLKQFDNVEIFPSRIILFDQADANQEKVFLSHKWSKSLPFLHVPQVTTLPQDFDTRAILFGTATQMGLDAIDLIKQPIKTTASSFDETIEFEEKNPDKTEEKDAEKTENEKKTKNETTEEESDENASEDFGFVKDTDIAQGLEKPHKTPLPDEAIESVTKEIPETESEEVLAGEAPGFSTYGPIFVEGAKKVAQQFKRFVPSSILTTTMRLLTSGNSISKLIILVIIAILLIGAGSLWYFFGVKATVTLTLASQTISQDQTITFTTTGSSDPSKSIVAAHTVSVTEKGTVSGNTTGTKDIGNPAKGTVTIFNNDVQSHTFSKGTVITSSNNLTFTLDADAIVASSSPGDSVSTVDVPVTASTIGTESNLPSNTKFTFSGVGLVAAKNANAFSGGTKQSIVVVGQKDEDALISQLTDNLKDKAKQDLASQISSDEVILPEFTKTTAGITTFDQKLGSQAKTLSLNGSITYETIAYKKSDIESYTHAALNGKLPANSNIVNNGTAYSVKDMTVKNGTATVTLTMKEAYIPKIETQTVKNQIAGQSFSSARDILSALPQFSDATFVLSPNLFFLPKSLPKLSHNITLTVTAND